MQHKANESRRLPAADGSLEPPAISVCVCVKNRSRIPHNGRELTLFPNSVRCLTEAARMPQIGTVELVVADFQSDDWPLSQWLEEAAAGLQLQVVTLDGPFSRGLGLNAAVARARSDRLLLCDADILIEPEAIDRALEVASRGRVWMPVCRYLDQQGGLERWHDRAYGISALDRSLFDAAGAVPEFYSWGGEDDLFFARLALHTEIVRERCQGLVHQWHPQDLRFEHYQRQVKSDFNRQLAAVDCLGSHNAPFKKFICEHPHWQGELHLYSDGRMARPGIDSGAFELDEGRQILLKWDRWPSKTLCWDGGGNVYRDQTGPLALREVRAEG